MPNFPSLLLSTRWQIKTIPGSNKKPSSRENSILEGRIVRNAFTPHTFLPSMLIRYFEFRRRCEPPASFSAFGFPCLGIRIISPKRQPLENSNFRPTGLRLCGCASQPTAKLRVPIPSPRISDLNNSPEGQAFPSVAGLCFTFLSETPLPSEEIKFLCRP